jgi:hypothetical protein
VLRRKTQRRTTEVNMLGFAVHFNQRRLEVSTHLRKDGSETMGSISVRYFSSILRHEDQMDVKLTDTVPTVSDLS